MLMMESAVQIPNLIQTGSGELVRVIERRLMNSYRELMMLPDLPETGGKNIARIARNMSEPHILMVCQIFR